MMSVEEIYMDTRASVLSSNYVNLISYQSLVTCVSWRLQLANVEMS